MKCTLDETLLIYCSVCNKVLKSNHPILMLLLLFIPLAFALREPVDYTLPTKRLLDHYGYPLEKYTLETPDGYILTTLRIPHGKNSSTPNKKPILMVHGMFGKCEDYLLLGPDRSIGFILADNGYDVWLMNARGSLYSKKHRFLSNAVDSDYWKFSWHEIATIDIPVNIDFIINKTGVDQVYYLGHSQGGTTFFVLTSYRPEYNAKIRAGAVFAPSIFEDYKVDTLISKAARHAELVEMVIRFTQWYQITPYLTFFTDLLSALCAFSTVTIDLCALSIGIAAERESGYIKRSRIPHFTKIGIGGASAFQMIHSLQNIKQGHFQLFDYGPKENLIKYNSTTPPRYNLSLITAPVLILYCEDDNLAPRHTLERAMEIIKSATGYLIPGKLFTHFDFALAEDARDLVYKPVLDYFKKFDVS